MNIMLLFFMVASAWATAWVSNKDHSQIQFTVPYMSVSELSGRFSEFQADVQIDERGRPTEVVIWISTASVTTDNAMRDGHLRGADFFDAKTYPRVRFRSSQIRELKAGSFEATGELTLKKTTRMVSIPFTLTPPVKDTWGFENRFAKFTSTLQRTDYGIRWNKTLDEQKYLVGDAVTIFGVFQLQPKAAKTPASKHMIPDTNHIREREQKLRDQDQESGFSARLRKLINGK